MTKREAYMVALMDVAKAAADLAHRMRMRRPGLGRRWRGY